MDEHHFYTVKPLHRSEGRTITIIQEVTLSMKDFRTLVHGVPGLTNSLGKKSADTGHQCDKAHKYTSGLCNGIAFLEHKCIRDSKGQTKQLSS